MNLEVVETTALNVERSDSTNSNLSNCCAIGTVGDGFPVPREAKRLPYDENRKISVNSNLPNIPNEAPSGASFPVFSLSHPSQAHLYSTKIHCPFWCILHGFYCEILWD